MAISTMDGIEQAAALLSDIAERDAPLAASTTYRVGGRADVMIRPRGIDDLHRISAAAAATGLPVLVVGRGSNMLVADSGFHGLAVSLSEIPATFAIDDARVTAGAAAALPQLARRIAAAGLTGFEWAVGVPGSVGGAVRMNAGGHGSDMSAVLATVELFDFHADRHGIVPTGSLGLRFRGSDLADHQLVIAATLDLAHGDRATSERELNEIVRWRREHQPGGQNAGSVFVNPIPGVLSSGELIDRAGLRGLVHGSAFVSDKHANFIQASDGGRAADVVALIELVRRRVAESSGVELRSEVRLVGFDDGDTARHDDNRGVSW